MRRTILFIAGIVSAMMMVGCNNDQPYGASNAEPEPVGGPPLLRRLTESQYRASIADIFGEDVPVVARFGRALRSDGLVAVGTGEAGISPYSLEQYDVAANGIADYILAENRRDHYLPCIPLKERGIDGACVEQVIRHYGDKLFRRPLNDEQVARYVNQAALGAERLGDVYQGLHFALVGLLTAPEFVFRLERVVETSGQGAELDAYSKATRLSYFLTNSTPDPVLMQAAAAGELDTRQGLEQQVNRLLGSAKFEQALRAFFADMLEFDLFDDVAKDSTIYPAFNSAVAIDAQEQTLRTVVYHLLENRGDYRELFTLKDTFLTRPLGVVYRVPVPTRNGWEKTAFPDNSERAGIQSHIAFLSLHAHPGRSSPTLRGMAIREVFLCQEVPDPPPDVDFSAIDDPEGNPMPTARDRLWAHNSQPACAGCHKIMDPPGLALENYDGIGTWRSTEGGAAIDASGSLDGFEFETPAEFGKALAEHPETPRCLTEKMYRFAVGRDTVWGEREYMDYLISRFAQNNYRVPDLMRTIALSNNFFAIDPSIAHTSSLASREGATP